MKQGDFTSLAKDYVNRTGYSKIVLTAIAKYIGAFDKNIVVADVGAGTGKLTENLIELGFRGYAVEPNKAMREEGISILSNDSFSWLEGSGEQTNLEDSSVDWVLMGSSFHWTDRKLALKEFYRILKPGGFFTALWNPRNIETNEFHKKIETKIHSIIPHLKRLSSGLQNYTYDLESVLLYSNYFKDILFSEGYHQVKMSPDRYMGAWRSVNDIQAQAGAEKFEEILGAIQEEIADMEFIEVPYKTRAWTVQSTQK